MDKVITESDAYKMYLQSGFEELMPFKMRTGLDYLNYLQSMGYEVLLEDAVNDQQELH